MPGRVFARRAVLAAGFGLVAGGARAEEAQEAAVTIDNFAFTPATLTVRAGTRVVFTNRDDIPHSVMSSAQPSLFRSPALDSDESFAMRFDKPGSYGYFCSLHPHMQGSVVVR